MGDAETTPDAEPIGETANALFHRGENVVYAFAGALLAATAVIVLATLAYHLVVDLTDGVESAVTAALDGLLLVFILLELLAGVRTTMAERKLVAEPFLVVGIIASIKEIIVVALKAEPSASGDEFDHAMIEIGVLGGLVLLLAAATLLIRLKERSPEE